MDMTKYIEPTKAHEGQMVEVERGHDEWLSRKLLSVLPRPQTRRFICAVVEDPTSSAFWAKARISVPKTYKELHAECGLKVGHEVRIVRKANNGEGGWTNSWVEDMDRCVGKCGTIVASSDVHGMKVSLGGKDLFYPCFVLEKVDPPATPTDEIIHVPGTVEHWIYKGHAYRMATASDAGKKCIVSDVSVQHAFQRMCEYFLTKVDPTSPYLYRTGCAGWKYALIQDDSLLKRESPPEYKYVKFEWEDRKKLRGSLIYRERPGKSRLEIRINKAELREDGTILFEGWDPATLVKEWKFLKTNEPVGKKVLK